MTRPAATTRAASSGSGQNGSSEPPTAVASAARPAGARRCGRGTGTAAGRGRGAGRALVRPARLRRSVGGRRGTTNASRSSAASRAAGGRFPGSTASALSTAASSRRGSSPRRAERGGAPEAIVEATWGSGTPQNGWLPASASQRITPTAQTSLRSDASSPERRSGEMYASVPGTSPTAVSVSASSNCARPKSRTRIEIGSLSSTSTFEGLTSRWTIPCRWACASPSSTCAAISTAAASSSPSTRSASRSVRPRTYS